MRNISNPCLQSCFVEDSVAVSIVEVEDNVAECTEVVVDNAAAAAAVENDSRDAFLLNLRDCINW